MPLINIHQAKTHLSRLLDRVARGEEIVIARSGEPVARLVPIGRQPRKPGRLEGRLTMSESFDDPLPAEFLAAFSGDDA